MLLFRFLTVGVFISVLAACGFQPLYYQDGERVSIRSDMRSVFIEPIEDRIGQELRTNLKKTLNPTGANTQKEWNLAIVLTESIEKISLESTSFSTRANLIVTAQVELRSIVPGLELSFSGLAKSISSYNIVDSDYADIVANRDAQSRAVVSLSNDIRRQLALWLREVED